MPCAALIRREALALLPALAVAGAAVSLSASATAFRLGVGTLAWASATYLALALCLQLLWRSARGRAALAALASLAVGGWLALVLRMDADRLGSFAGAAAGVLLLASAHALLSRACAGEERDGRPARRRVFLAGLGFAGSAVGLALAGYWASETARWHLLHDLRAVGVPLQRLAGRPLESVRDDLWRRAARPSASENAAAVAPKRREAGPDAPNVLLVVVDTLRADALAAYGGRPDCMPRLNALAERALVLRDVHANASWTRASVGALMTGLLPEEHGAVGFHDRLPESWSTLAEVLSERGYRTAAFVSNWVQVGIETGFGQGFDVFRELAPVEEMNRALDAGARDVRGRYARAAEVTDAVLAWTREPPAEASARGPAFLWVHYLDPHAPYLAGEEPGSERLTPRERRRGAYRQELRYLDAELARLIEGARASLPGRTVVVVTSDHGEEFWEHGAWGHGHSLYGELLHVPVIVDQDGTREGATIDERFELRDLFSLVLCLAQTRRVDLHCWTQRHARTVRYASQYLDRDADVRADRRATGLRRVERGRHALVWSAYGPTLEVYDEKRDPGETLNRADRERDVTARLWALLDEQVRFWTRREPVQRTAEELRFLSALGYAGGAPVAPPNQ